MPVVRVLWYGTNILFCHLCNPLGKITVYLQKQIYESQKKKPHTKNLSPLPGTTTQCCSQQLCSSFIKI